MPLSLVPHPRAVCGLIDCRLLGLTEVSSAKDVWAAGCRPCTITRSVRPQGVRWIHLLAFPEDHFHCSPLPRVGNGAAPRPHIRGHLQRLPRRCAEAAFQYAVNIWAGQISAAPVDHRQWRPRGPTHWAANILGLSVAEATGHRNFTGATEAAGCTTRPHWPIHTVED